MINKKPFFIAEIGINHNGSLSLAKKLIDSAKKCGVNAVKFQSFTNDRMNIEKLYKNKKADFKFDNKIKNLEDIIDRITLTKKDHKSLQEYCKKKKIIFFSTPLDVNWVDFLDKINVPIFKIASMDLNNPEILSRVASKKKPIILSTGFSSILEIHEAIETIKKINSSAKIYLLHCVSAYPPKNKNLNLKNIIMLKKTFNVEVGFSDHTIGVGACLASIALGATVIEKHFTLDKKLIGWDHSISADPQELKIIVNEGRKIFSMLGSYNRNISDHENNFKKNMRRSIVVKKFISKGKIILRKDLEFKRPGTGIDINKIGLVLNRIAKKNLKPDTILKFNHLK
tara:strand:- start:3141 stop:4163 length:1023 start_codon:yes stop_codon:yes gene_type:complete